MRLGTDEHLFESAQTVTAPSRTGAVVGRAASSPPSSRRSSCRCAPTADGSCTVTFTAAKLRTPGAGDTRRLGAHYYSFDYRR